MSSNDVNYFSAHPHIEDVFSRSDDRAHKSISREDNKLGGSYTRENVPRGAWVEVDRKAIAHNLRIIRKHVGGQRHIMAVVGADAYGHGAVPVSKTALENGADHLGVFTVEEAVELREAGIDASILILSQPPMRTIPYLLAYNIMPTVTTAEFALALGEEADLHDMVAKYHLAIDTGLNRIGVFFLDVVDFMESINFHRGLECAGVFTQFATADDVSDWEFRKQLKRFNESLRLLKNARIDPGLVHTAGSAAIARYPESHFDMVRAGIAMYGLVPGPVLQDRDDLRPAMSVKAQVSYVKEPQMGEGVSYGFNYRVAKPVQIATLPLGYADGVRRDLSGRMKVLCHGNPCQQVGAICMDQMMIEIPLDYSMGRLAKGVEIGDEVVIIGAQEGLEITVDMMAEELDTISYELVCSFGSRLPRIYL